MRVSRPIHEVWVDTTLRNSERKLWHEITTGPVTPGPQMRTAVPFPGPPFQFPRMNEDGLSAIKLRRQVARYLHAGLRLLNRRLVPLTHYDSPQLRFSGS